MYKEFKDLLLNINRYESRKFILDLKDKIDVIEEIVIPAMNEIGKGWQSGEYSLSQVYMKKVTKLRNTHSV